MSQLSVLVYLFTKQLPPLHVQHTDRSLVTAFSFTLKALQKLRILQSHVQQFQNTAFMLNAVRLKEWTLYLGSGGSVLPVVVVGSDA